MSHQQGPGAGSGGPPYGQQPPYGQPPPYGQQPPYGWGAPPPGPGRRGRGLVVLIAVIALVVIGGGVAGGIVVLGGDDKSAQADDGPTGGPTTGPTQSPTGSPTPSPDPTPTTSPGTPSGDLAKLEVALSRHGFHCDLSIARPVPVRTCYHDPYLPYGDAYVQSVVGRDGSAKLVDIQVHASGESQRVADIMGKALDSLRGTLLTPEDIRALRDRPNAMSLRLSWGRASSYRSGPDYLSITITSPGYEMPYIELGEVRTSTIDFMRRYRSQRYRCTVDPGFEAVNCQRRVDGQTTYAASALAPCVRRKSGRFFPCPGPAPSMTLFWGLDQRRVTNAMVRKAIDAVFLPGAKVALDGPPPAELRSWLFKSLDGKLHVADFDGLQFSVDPNAMFTDRDAEVALSIKYPPSP